MEINREGIVETVTGDTQPRKLFGSAALLQHDTARRMIEEAEAYSALTVEFKQKMFDILEEYEDAMRELYGAQKGGKSGRAQIEDIPCKMKVKVEVYRTQKSDGSIIAAQSLVREILDDMKEDMPPWADSLLRSILQMDDGVGSFSTASLKLAKKAQIPHPKWPLAVRAIESSIRTVRSRRNILFYRADEPHEYMRVAMNFSEIGGGQA